VTFGTGQFLRSLKGERLGERWGENRIKILTAMKNHPTISITALSKQIDRFQVETEDFASPPPTGPAGMKKEYNHHSQLLQINLKPQRSNTGGLQSDFKYL